MSFHIDVEYIPDLTPSLEKYVPIPFYKKMHTWRVDQLSIVKSVNTSDKFQLPDNSVLHILDNLHKTETIDTPHFDHINFPETYLKYIFHVTEVTPPGPLSVHYESKYIYRIPGVAKNLMAFRTEHGSKFKYLQRLDALPRRKESLTIVNYNTLFRLFVYGRLRLYRRINHILSAVINTALSIPGDKRHFIHLPITPSIYPRPTFIRSKKSLSIGAITFPEDAHWIMMMHFLNFVDSRTKNSIFTEIPKNRLKDLNFFFTLGTKDDVHFNIYNLEDIVNMNVRNRIYLRLCNHMNALAAKGISPEVFNSVLNDIDDSAENIDTEPTIRQELDTKDTDPVVEKPVEVEQQETDSPVSVPIKDKKLETKISEITQKLVYYTNAPTGRYSPIKVPYRQEIKLYAPDVDLVEQLLQDTEKDIYQVTIKTIELDEQKYVTVGKSNYSPIEQLQKEKCIGYTNTISSRAIENVIKHTYQVIAEDIPEETSEEEVIAPSIKIAGIQKSIDAITSQPPSELVKQALAKNKESVVTRKQEVIHPVEVADTSVVDNYHETLHTAKDRVDTHPELSSKQKERYKAMIDNVSTLTINNKPLSDIIKSTESIDLSASTLEQYVDVPDKSAAASKIDSFHKQYNSTLFHADTASVVTSFIDKDMVPIKIEQKPIRNELNNSMEYSVQFEEMGANKKHTVKFTMPVVDEEGICLINGVKKKLKSQVVNVPICKLSETRVSLVSNYNKTIVERKVSKNKNYLAYITEVITAGVGANVISCEYGTVSPDFDIAYEYATVGKKYTSLILESKGKSPLTLCFDYDNRLQILQVPENKYNVVLGLEKNLGVLLGTIPKDNTYLFINQDNYISTLTTGNKIVENAPVSIVEYILDYIPAEAVTSIYPPVEYVVLKILDKVFPIGFILAYKLGLRPLLSYLQAGYKVIDKRSKALLYTNETLDEMLEQQGEYSTPTSSSNKTSAANKWRIETGIELIHEVDSYEEFQAIKDNWEAMSTEQKTVSDTQCVELTGMTNQVYAEYLELPMRMKNIQYLTSLDKLNLSTDDYFIVGSAAAVAYGYNAVNTDIDIVIRPGIAEELLKSKKIVKNSSGVGYTTPDGHVDINDTNLDGSVMSEAGYNRRHKATVTVGDKYTLLTKKELVLFYQELYTKSNKDKHAKTLEYLTTQVDTTTSSSAAKQLSVKVQPDKVQNITIPFKDVILVIDRYPLQHSFILAGLIAFKTNNYYLEELDNKDSYYQILLDHKFSVNYLRGIDAFFELFIDPITKDVLTKMKEPTNVTDLLIRATEMLTTLHSKEAASMANHRIRGYEQFNAILYNEMSRQYAAYLTNKTSTATFSMNPEAVYQRIIMNQSFAIAEDINPYHNLKEKTQVTYAGVGGRTNESFVVNDRRYPDDAVGILSEATTDSGKVAMNAQLSVAPSLENARGMFNIPEINELAPGNTLAPASLMMPFTDRDDSRRTSFLSGQASHVVPVKDSGHCRVRTGYERILPYQTDSLYVSKAKGSGIVSDIDYDTKMVKVKYEDGTEDTYNYAETYTDIGDGHICHNLTLAVSVGDKVNKNDVIVYNQDFFKYDKYSGKLDMTHGVMATVALLEEDGTLEDSCCISEELSKRLQTDTISIRSVILNSTSVVHYCANVGTEVLNTDDLVVFEDGEGLDIFDTYDDETQQMLSKMNRKTPRAKYNGVVSQIDVYYGCEVSDMHPTLKKIIAPIVKNKNDKVKYSESSHQKDSFYPSAPIPPGTKFKGVEFHKDTVLLLFYIKQATNHEDGDKLAIANQLKSTTMSVYPYTPTTESGVPVDVVFSSDRIAARVVLSPYFMGISDRLLEKLEEDVCDMYFGS